MFANSKPRFSRQRSPLRGVSLVVALTLGVPVGSAAQTLRGSMASVDRQNRIARDHDYSFLNNGERVRFFASKGWLVRVQPTSDFVLRGVSFPYARPEVELFVRRLSSQYRAGCGEQLVVTSLTRPTSGQPRNASDKSVHPTGMALDLRRPNGGRCRAWLEGVLLDLERAGVIDATLERYPVHYHVAVFPRQYAAYVAARQPGQAAPVQQAVAIAQPAVTTEDVERLEYRVRRGDSLWTIARTHGTTVDVLLTANQLAGSRIYVGQVIDVPLGD
jgi:LysM repeat protein